MMSTPPKARASRAQIAKLRQGCEEGVERLTARLAEIDRELEFAGPEWRMMLELEQAETRAQRDELLECVTIARDLERTRR